MVVTLTPDEQEAALICFPHLSPEKAMIEFAQNKNNMEQSDRISGIEQIRSFKAQIGGRLSRHLSQMKEDDSIAGFKECWNIVWQFFNEEIEHRKIPLHERLKAKPGDEAAHGGS